MTATDWQARNKDIEMSPRLEALKMQMAKDDNIERQYHQLHSLLQLTFRDRYKQTKEMGDWDSEKVYERKRITIHPSQKEWRS